MSSVAEHDGHDDISAEQAYISALYGRLDELRRDTSRRLSEVLATTGGTPQARSERDAAFTLYSDRLAQLNAVEEGLCFGRLDFEDGTRRYIGRIGLFSEDADQEPLLIDWRAPAARPFYLATAVAPLHVRRRRHIRTKNRTVVSVDDEVLDLSAPRRSAHEDLTGEAALLAALSRRRTGRMRDIVETIQAEQDRVIRYDLNGTLVVQGDPGTGKTAVALHRAAYLLYTYRDQLASRGVLVVGPNATFLRYISHVLPSLAETDVLLCTLGDLYPGVRARGREPEVVAEIKGRAVMASVLARAVADRQWVPTEPIELQMERETLLLDPHTCARARERARRSGKLHNHARTVFEEAIIDDLARQVAERIGTDPYFDDPFGGDDAPGDPNLLSEADLADIRAEMREERSVRRALDDMWPLLTPQQLLAGLFASEERLRVAAPELSEQERALLLRAPTADWTPADVPLLDEAAELLGDIDQQAPHAATDLDEYAEGVLQILYGSRSFEAEHADEQEMLLASDALKARQLAERHEERERLTTAERAARDRKWAFGHIIVDEAQELSPMAWRLLMRRCPSRSMTIVGDVAQTGDLAGTTTWEAVLAPHLGDRWRQERLTVNYRTPAEIMEVAAALLADIDANVEPPRSVRETGVRPWRVAAPEGRLCQDVASAVLEELRLLDEGRLGVIVPACLLAEVGEAVTKVVPDAALGEDPELECRVVVLTVRQAKGLEFDTVIVVEPGRVLTESPRGHSDLYVALTRATQRLGIVHADPLPEVLANLSTLDIKAPEPEEVPAAR